MEDVWTRIKTEYIAGGVSQQALAEEYGVPYGTLRKRAKKEGWTALRSKSERKTGEKIAATVTEQKIKKIERLVDKLLEQSMTAARQNTKRPVVVRETTGRIEDGDLTVRIRTEYEDVKVVDKQGLRLLSQTARDLYDVVSKIRAAESGEDKSITVRFVSDNEDDAELAD